jgi:sugar phosphate isomerase/epimerase
MTEISYQLYCSRNWALTDTLAMLSQAGYTCVEGYGGLYGDTQALLSALNKTGLGMTTGHFDLDALEADPARAIALAKLLGMDAMFAPYVEQQDRPTGGAEWEAFATRVAEAGKPVLDAGLGYGWHNHDFELVDLGSGVTPLDLLAQATPDMRLELDLGWVTRAGGDPVAAIRRYADQIIAVHIKDVATVGENTDEDGWADVGHGVTDWAPIHAALQEIGIGRYVLEHDNPTDHQRFATRSLKSVRAF